MDHIDFNREPTNKEICMMCHFSSECGKCCKSCNDQCNEKQHCQIGVNGQADRLVSWMDIVINNVEFARLKCFIDENYGKPLVSGALPCNHNFVQKDTYWKSCTHCGFLAPLWQ
jgi:hypothetical protein